MTFFIFYDIIKEKLELIKVRDNFNQRYISLMKGKISNFSLGEITFLLENLNGFEINTLCIKKSDNYYYCKVDDMTVEAYHKKNKTQ